MCNFVAAPVDRPRNLHLLEFNPLFYLLIANYNIPTVEKDARKIEHKFYREHISASTNAKNSI